MIDMTIKPASCACVPCAYQIRSVAAFLESGTDFTNIINWVNAYDITTIPWGTYLQGTFTTSSATTPDAGTATVPCTGGTGYPINLTSCVGWNEDFTACVTGAACPTTLVARSQFFLPVPTAYYVIAYGTSISLVPEEYLNCGEGGTWLAQGCISPQQADSDYPLIVDLPIPDNSLDDTIQVQYYWLGIIKPGTGYGGEGGIFEDNMQVIQDLNFTAEQAAVAGFGAAWNPSQVCDATPDDPFTGSDPP